MPYESSGRFRANRNYFLLRIAEFENFQDPDMFSPHMDLLFVRRVYAEFQQKLPDISFDTAGFESTPCVLATRPERAARDLAKRYLVSANSKYEIEIMNATPQTFTLRYKRSWRQLNEVDWSQPITIARNMVVFRGEQFVQNTNRYTTVELPFLAKENIFVQFFRLEPSFQFYEYAAVVEPLDNRRLRLPGWNDAEGYIPFDKKILVKSLFRPFRITQGPNEFVCSANSAREAFMKSKSKLQNNQVEIEITDTFTKHRFVNNAGDVRFLLDDRPRVNQFKRRADNKRRRTHCVEKNYLFEREPFVHVLHSSFRSGAIFFRELRKNLENALAKFRAIERSERLNDRMKESATFILLKNRWFLMVCAVLTDGAEDILEVAFNFLNTKNPARFNLEYADFPPNLYETLHTALMDVDENLDDIQDFVHEVDVDTLTARNLPLPPSLGCGNPANQAQGNQMQVVEGHNPFPDDLLSGADERTFVDWDDAAGDTRAKVLDTYTKSIRDDVPRIQKRDTAFIHYLESISIEPVVLQQQQPLLHFGESKKPNPFKVVVQALKRFLGI